MSDDPKIPLRDHLVDRINGLEKQLTLSINSVKDNIAVALAASEKAIGKAELASERRFEGVNEFRATLSDQAATFLPRAEFSVQHSALLSRIEQIDKIVNTIAGQTSGGRNVWAYLFSGGALLISAATLVVLIVTRTH